MAVQSSRPLNEEINGGKVRDEEVEIEIEGLFDNLCGDENLSSSHFGGARFAESCTDLFFSGKAVSHSETSMKEHQSL